MKERIFILVLIFMIVFVFQSSACEWISRLEALKLNLFFFDENYEIEKVPFYFETNNFSKEKIVKVIIEKILEGPQDSLLSFIPEGTTLNHVVFLGETIILDFSEELQSYGGGSFNVMKIRKQFESLYQLPFIKDIVFTVEGKGEIDGVLQP